MKKFWLSEKIKAMQLPPKTIKDEIEDIRAELHVLDGAVFGRSMRNWAYKLSLSFGYSKSIYEEIKRINERFDMMEEFLGVERVVIPEKPLVPEKVVYKKKPVKKRTSPKRN